MPLTERQRLDRRKKIQRWAERRLKRRAAAEKLPDEIADETVEVVTPNVELEALPDHE